MKIKFDKYVSGHFSKGKDIILYFDTKKGLLLDQNKNAIKDQQRNLKKLEKILENYHLNSDNYGEHSFDKERKI